MLVRVDACGICPTDLKKIEKGLLPGPRVFGHEIAGTVAALGAGTTGFREGYDIRIYVPFGTHWIPYFYRRLRERRENVLFVLRNLFS